MDNMYRLRIRIVLASAVVLAIIARARNESSAQVVPTKVLPAGVTPTAKHVKVQSVAYTDGKISIVTIYGGKKSASTYVFDGKTTISQCKLYDIDGNFVDDWAFSNAPGKLHCRNGMVTVVLKAKDHRPPLRSAGPGYIVIQTSSPSTTTTPGTITTQPVDIDPCS